MSRGISVIKRNGKLEYRCSNSINDTFTLDGHTFEPIIDSMDEVIARKMRQEGSSGTDVIEEWRKYIKEERGGSFDLDDYLRFVEIVFSDPKIANDLKLSQREICLLEDAKNFLLKERQLPVGENFPNYYFWVYGFIDLTYRLTERDDDSILNIVRKLDRKDGLYDVQGYIQMLDNSNR